MSRFRYSGINWEGRKWEVADPVRSLGVQIEHRWPPRHKSDGTVASENHDIAAPSSDHRPKPVVGAGVVRAIDVGIDLAQGELLFQELRKARDTRTRYVIFQNRIFFGPGYAYLRGRTPWKEYPYSGTAHSKHVHISTLSGADEDGSLWDIGGEAMLTIVQLQEALIEAGWDLGSTGADGDYGPKTKAAHVASMVSPGGGSHVHGIEELVGHNHKGSGKTGGVIRSS